MIPSPDLQADLIEYLREYGPSGLQDISQELGIDGSFAHDLLADSDAVYHDFSTGEFGLGQLVRR